MNNRSEANILSHIVVLANFSILTLLLFYNIYTTPTRNNISIPIIAFFVLSMWVLHLLQKGSDIQRLTYYSLVATGVMIYFGTSADSLTDMPIILSLYVICLAFANSMKLIYIICSSFPIAILYHIFYTKYLTSPGVPLITYRRMLLGGVCLICCIVVSRYVTGRYIMLEREHARLKSGHTNALKENERLLTGISHELRTPINAVVGLSDILVENNALTDQAPDINTINLAGRQLGGQINDILYYSEIISGKLISTLSDYSIISVSNDALTEIAETHNCRSLDIVTNIQPDIPCMLSGDEEKIKTVLKALLSNAVSYTPSGGVFLNISKRSTDYGINLLIDIYDTGTGMNRKEIDEIFRLITDRERSSVHISKGLGLGLIIVHGLVSSMKGFLSISPQPEGGLHVNVTLPQVIKDYRPSIALSSYNKYKIAVFLIRDKYSDKRVADYYDRLFYCMAEGLNLDINSLPSHSALKEFCQLSHPTHCFISTWEYEMTPDFYEELSKKCCVCVFTTADYKKPLPENLHEIKAPVSILPILNLLNATEPGLENFITPHKPFYDNRITALVADDEKMNLLVAQKVLSTYGIKTDLASSGAEAINMCSMQEYDIIFIDHMMPEYDGIETLKAIRKLRHGAFNSTPMVALTATTVSGARDMFIRNGFNDFIPKPIEQTTMTKVLRRLLTEKGDLS